MIQWIVFPWENPSEGVRVSSGHLRVAEAPTEAAAENAGVQWTPLRSRSTDRGGSRECRGNPCQVQDRVLRNGVKNSGRGAKSVQWTFFAWGNPSEGVRVSSGHLREAEAPTEAAAENSPYFVMVRFLR